MDLPSDNVRTIATTKKRKKKREHQKGGQMFNVTVLYMKRASIKTHQESQVQVDKTN